MRYEQYLLLATIALAFGFWLLAHGVLHLLGGVFSGIWVWIVRQLRPRAIQLQVLAREARTPTLGKTESRYDTLTMIIIAVMRFPIPMLIGVVIAPFMQDWVLSSISILVGAVVSATLFTRMRRAYYNRLTDELEMLILQFVSRYPLRNSVATALAESADTLPGGILNQAAANTATRLKLGDGENPYRDLLRVPHPVARRFAGVLMRANLASPEVFLDLLGQLREATESRRELHQRVRRDLTLESGTVSLLQVVLIITLVAVAFLPSWREYYVASMGNRVFYITMVAMGVIGTVISEYEIRYMEEAS